MEPKQRTLGFPVKKRKAVDDHDLASRSKRTRDAVIDGRSGSIDMSGLDVNPPTQTDVPKEEWNKELYKFTVDICRKYEQLVEEEVMEWKCDSNQDPDYERPAREALQSTRTTLINHSNNGFNSMAVLYPRMSKNIGRAIDAYAYGQDALHEQLSSLVDDFSVPTEEKGEMLELAEKAKARKEEAIRDAADVRKRRRGALDRYHAEQEAE